jgi:hypothetical protein
MSDHALGGIPAGMKWCPHCGGYVSSLKVTADRCTHYAGTGLVWVESQETAVGRNGGGPPASQ